jgi:UPF0755 protein
MSSNPVLRFFASLGSVGIFLVPLLLGAFGVFYFFNITFLKPAQTNCVGPIPFTIKKDWGIEDIAKALEKENFIRSWYSISLYKEHGNVVPKDQNTIVEGEYEISPCDPPKKILAALFSGKRVSHQFTIPVGAKVADVSRIIEETKLAEKREVYEAFRDETLMRTLGIPAYLPEGFLLAGTHSFTKPITARKIIGTIIEESKMRIEKELPNWRTKAGELGFRPYEIITLASLLEEESSNPNERKNISSVYHNRLRIGMPLQSNAALIYGIPDFSGRITQDDIKADGPYNTYLNKGLPPTPISSPSINSIDAAVNPADTDYLYFFSRGGGKFTFSATFKEHQKRRKEFQSKK